MKFDVRQMHGQFAEERRNRGAGIMQLTHTQALKLRVMSEDCLIGLSPGDRRFRATGTRILHQLTELCHYL